MLSLLTLVRRLITFPVCKCKVKAPRSHILEPPHNRFMFRSDPASPNHSRYAGLAGPRSGRIKAPQLPLWAGCNATLCSWVLGAMCSTVNTSDCGQGQKTAWILRRLSDILPDGQGPDRGSQVDYRGNIPHRGLLGTECFFVKCSQF